MLLLVLHGAGSFYVPGVAPINFHRNDPVEIKVGWAWVELLGSLVWVSLSLGGFLLYVMRAK